jgi:hypothetical protein
LYGQARRTAGTKTGFLSHLCIKVIFYQDRLGTNIGKTPKQARFVEEYHRAKHSGANRVDAVRTNKPASKQASKPASERASLAFMLQRASQIWLCCACLLVCLPACLPACVRACRDVHPIYLEMEAGAEEEKKKLSALSHYPPTQKPIKSQDRLRTSTIKAEKPSS